MPRAVLITLLVTLSLTDSARAQNARVDFVEPDEQQSQRNAPDTIWFDNFDQDRDYLEPDSNSPEMRYSSQIRLGSAGRSMESFYPRGRRGVGGRKVVFGDAPFGRPHRRGEKFDQIYWRYYVKYPVDWRGGGEAKHSRAIVFTSPKWTQASILHVWTAGNRLTLDPVRAVRDGRVISRKYNDFDSFRWLGNAPKGDFEFYSRQERGRWVGIEVQWRLNTPGQSDGVARLWVDGTLDAERTGMNFRGTYDEHGINAVFLESYWNDGSPVDQYRWIDHFVISTNAIGPIEVPGNPVVVPRLSENAARWQLQVVPEASNRPVWRSGDIKASEPVRVDRATGQFLMDLAKASRLPGGERFRFQIREFQNGESATGWSPPHWPVVVRDDSRLEQP